MKTRLKEYDGKQNLIKIVFKHFEKKKNWCVSDSVRIYDYPVKSLKDNRVQQPCQ